MAEDQKVSVPKAKKTPAEEMAGVIHTSLFKQNIKRIEKENLVIQRVGKRVIVRDRSVEG
jgi:hypothetical protein